MESEKHPMKYDKKLALFVKRFLNVLGVFLTIKFYIWAPEEGLRVNTVDGMLAFSGILMTWFAIRFVAEYLIIEIFFLDDDQN